MKIDTELGLSASESKYRVTPDARALPVGRTALANVVDANTRSFHEPDVRVEQDLRKSDYDISSIVNEDRIAFLEGVWAQYKGHADLSDEGRAELIKYNDDLNRHNVLMMYKELSSEFGDEAKGHLEAFMQIFGVANFSRYEPDRLTAQYLKWIEGRMEGIDTILVAGRDGDVTGAFEGVSRPYENTTGDNVLVFEAGPDVGDIEAVAFIALSQNVSVKRIVLAAHGVLEIEAGADNKNTLDVSISDLGISTNTDLSDLGELLHELSPRQSPVVVLDSCSTSAEGERYMTDSLARIMSSKMRGVYVIAPDRPIFTTKIDESGTIRYLNTTHDGRVSIFNPTTFTERATPLKGTSVMAKTNMYRNGELVKRDTTGHGVRPSRVTYSGVSGKKPS